MLEMFLRAEKSSVNVKHLGRIFSTRGVYKLGEFYQRAASARENTEKYIIFM